MEQPRLPRKACSQARAAPPAAAMKTPHVARRTKNRSKYRRFDRRLKEGVNPCGGEFGRACGASSDRSFADPCLSSLHPQRSPSALGFKRNCFGSVQHRSGQPAHVKAAAGRRDHLIGSHPAKTRVLRPSLAASRTGRPAGTKKASCRRRAARREWFCGRALRSVGGVVDGGLIAAGRPGAALHRAARTR